ncbi:hypothetical protein scyTo_0004633 [Scyliorhinus torazame]|uniref:Uncharacterized protein n=1 Tax=Scyliorhinus torazame TaxID=75743 RepID=A0A401NUT9_SCYTO|nr:hypothetical protein [Scyliorhinus torazame]
MYFRCLQLIKAAERPEQRSCRTHAFLHENTSVDGSAIIWSSLCSGHWLTLQRHKTKSKGFSVDPSELYPIRMCAVEQFKAHEMSSKPLFCNGILDPQVRNQAISVTEVKQDRNFNIMEDIYDKNENLGQLHSGGTTFRNSLNLKGEPDLQVENEVGKCFPAKGSSSLELGRRPLSVENVRVPPEGAEMGHTSKPGTVKDCEEFAVSPSDDNGYSSSCLSIESPDSVEGSIWEATETIRSDNLDLWQQAAATEINHVPGSPPAADSLLPSILEAVQSLHEKQRFKEQEKEKHQTQVIMYRRLALLRWIRNLQQKVMDHQSRLQESYDTILNNRKELLKFIKQGII